MRCCAISARVRYRCRKPGHHRRTGALFCSQHRATTEWLLDQEWGVLGTGIDQRLGEVPRPARAAIAAEGSAVYVIQCEVTCRLKIGFTTSPTEQRLRELQVGSPTRLRVAGRIPAPRSFEGALHAAFAGARSHGEWFEPTPLITGTLRLMGVHTLPASRRFYVFTDEHEGGA